MRNVTAAANDDIFTRMLAEAMYAQDDGHFAFAR